MGHSLGGIIGFLYSAVYPNDVDALVSLDVVAPIFEFIGKKSVTQMAGLIDKYDVHSLLWHPLLINFNIILLILMQ